MLRVEAGCYDVLSDGHPAFTVASAGNQTTADTLESLAQWSRKAISMFRLFRLILLLCCVWLSVAPARAIDVQLGRLRFILNTPHDVTLLADGIPIIRESHFYMVKPGWTATLMNTDNVTPGYSTSYAAGVYTANVTYQNSEGLVRYSYELGPGNTYKVTVNYATKSQPAQIEWSMAYLNANLIAGMPWSANTVSGARSGTVPVFATTPDQTQSQLCPLVKSIHFDTNLGPLDVTIEASNSSVSGFRLFDARAGQQDWAKRNPIFWFGVGESPIPTVPEMRTITATWQLGEAPVRTVVPALDPAPVTLEREGAQAPYVIDLPIVPRPKERTTAGSACRLGQNVYITVPVGAPPEVMGAAVEIQQDLADLWGIDSEIGPSAPTGATVISLGVSTDSNVPAKEEGYYLSVVAGRVTIAGHDARGVYNAAQTLKQLIRLDPYGVYVKTATIRDWPSLKMRGVHWFGGPNGLAFHRLMLDRIVSRYKLNTMLYEVEFGKWASHPEIWHSTRGMTREDMQASVDHARSRFVEPIPLVNSLGHADWMFVNGQHRDLATDPNAPRQYNPENPAVYTLLFDVMQEAADIFQPRYFHIGHDEVMMTGTFPKAGSSKTATELILEDVVRINNWVKARGMRTMMWGDEFLHYPQEASDAGNAPDLATSALRRAGLPKDIVITDWHYNGSTTSFPSVPLWKREGWDFIGVPWYNWTNIQNLTSVVKQYEGMGMIQSTWAGWSMSPEIVNTSAYEQFCAYVVAAEMFWSGANPKVADLGYDINDAFRYAWNGTFANTKTCNGFQIDPGGGNAVMWDWIPGGPHPPAAFPSGELARDGVYFRLGNPVWLAGGLDPAGTRARSVAIPVDSKPLSSISVLWGTTFAGESGSRVARFTVGYADGRTVEVPILYGTQIFAFNDVRFGLQAPAVWKGKDTVGQGVTLRAWTWTNPRPNVPVTSVSVTSEVSEAAPVLVAMTGIYPLNPPLTLADAARALSLAGGIAEAGPDDIARLDLSPVSPGRIDAVDAVVTVRKALGIDP